MTMQNHFKFLAIASAALSLCGTGQAQTATLYGLVALGVAKISKGPYQVTTNTTSRLGVRGSEDLGDGLKANFQLEAELAADTGAADSTFWGRQAWVGLSDDWGAVRIGRTKNLLDGLSDDIDPFQTNGVVGDNTKLAWRAGVIGSRISNAMVYASPRVSGFRASGQFVMDELTTGGKKGWGVTATYEDKSWGLLAGYEKPAVTTAGRLQANAWVVGAWAKFSDARVSVGKSSADTKRTTGSTSGRGTFDGVLLGLEWKIGQGVVKGVYSKLTGDFPGLEKNRNEEFGLGFDYILSKRTLLYSMVGRERVAGLSAWQFGVTHRF